MLTFKGNRGNLLQHWVLCEILEILKQADPQLDSLFYVDATAMAPFSVPEQGNQPTRPQFEVVRNRLGVGESLYEKAWFALTQGNTDTYPSSAVFLRHLWNKTHKMLLCEIDPQRAAAIGGWLDQRTDVLWERDWRVRFRQGLTSPFEILLLSFDPYMYERNPDLATNKLGVMYPQDLCLVVDAIRDVQCPIIIQLSTYDVNNNNPQDLVEKSVKGILEPCGYKVAALIKADNAMMSFVLVRNADGLRERFVDMPSRFTVWLGSI